MAFLFTGRASSVASLAAFLPGSVDLVGWAEGVPRERLVLLFPLLITAVAVVKGLAYFGQFYLMGMVAQRVIVDLRTALFDHLLELSPSFFARRHTGDLHEPLLGRRGLGGDRRLLRRRRATCATGSPWWSCW